MSKIFILAIAKSCVAIDYFVGNFRCYENPLNEYQRVRMACSGWRPSSMAAVGEELWFERERP